MADNLDKATRVKTMRAVRSTNTAPEKKVRQALHAAGYRFRLQRRDLPGTPDIVLPRHKTIVFVHGCFWHGHGCSRAKMPATNTAYWQAKRDRTVRRDAATTAALHERGWRVLIVWTCDLPSGIKGMLDALDEA